MAMNKKLLTPEGLIKSKVPVLGQGITEEDIRALLPKKGNVKLDEDTMAAIRRIEEDTGLPQDLAEESLLANMDVYNSFKNCKFITYLNAIKFCNLKNHYGTNKEAWAIVFPDRFNKLVEEGRKVDSHVSMYGTGKLVTAVAKAMRVATDVRYSHYFDFSINKQFALADGRSDTKGNDGKDMVVTPMVQHLAAKELAILTKPPEELVIDVKVSQSDVMLEAQQDFNSSIATLVQQQAVMFAQGKDVASIQRIHNKPSVDAELVDD